MAACALVAACGGERLSSDEYERELRATMTELEREYGSAVGAVVERDGDNSSRSVRRVVEDLRGAQAGLREAAVRLEAIQPPRPLEREHRELVAGVRDMAESIDLLVRAQQLAATRPRQAEQLARRFADDDAFRRVEAAAAALAVKGVDAGL